MTRTAHRIGELVTRIQHDFLDTPGLTLTSAEAGARFDLDQATSGVLLDFLANAGVLARFYHDGQHAFLLRRGLARGAGTRPGRSGAMPMVSRGPRHAA